MSLRHGTMLLLGALGLASLAPRAMADDVTISCTTSPTQYEEYEPRNVVAIWIEDSAGTFVKTLMRYAVKRAEYLRAWNAVSLDRGMIDGQPDVITGATRSSHGPLSVTWDLTDFQGNPVPQGDYRIRFELTDHNSDSPTRNHEGGVMVAVNGVSSLQSGLTNGGFSDIEIDYQATPAPTDDAGTGPEDVVGSECESVTACIDGDGCCHPDCVYEVDDDCDPGSAQSQAGSGCDAGGGAGVEAALALAGAALLFAARRRRSS